MQNKEEQPPQNNEDNKPPIFSSWKGWYKFLLIALIGWIIILYLFTSYYS